MHRAAWLQASPAVLLALGLSACGVVRPPPPETPTAPAVPGAAQAPAPSAPAPSRPQAASKAPAAPAAAAPASAAPRAEAAQPAPRPEAPAAKPPAPKPAAPVAKPTTPAAKPAPVARAPAAAPPAAAPKPPAASLDLRALEQRLRETSALGLMTKLSIKNQVDDLVEQFRAYHQGRRPPTLPELRRPYEMLLMKLLSLLQDDDPGLAKALHESREAIWTVLTDREKFAQHS